MRVEGPRIYINYSKPFLQAGQIVSLMKVSSP